MTAEVEPPGDPFELSDMMQASAVYDPYPLLAAARSKHSVHRESPLGDAFPAPSGERPVFFVLGYDEVVAVLRDNETYSSSILAEALGPLLGRTMVAMDDPEHRAHRALVAPAFRPRLLALWEQSLVQRVVDEQIDSFASRGRTDLVRTLTFTVPVRVIAQILGLPESDIAQFQRWSLEVVSFIENWERGLAAYEALREYFAEQVAERRARPRADLITDLIQAEIDGTSLTDEDIFAFLKLLLPAGIETTYRSMGNLLFGLLTHPDQLDELKQARTLRENAIEEGLRWQPPFISLERECIRDTQLGGVDIPAGAIVTVFIGSANHDEHRFPDPECFDIHRNAVAHVTFGAGAHTCLGMHLARLESKVALNALLDRLPSIRLDDEAPAPHILGTMFRSPDSLPVRFDV